MSGEHPDLEALRRRLEDEERTYSGLLAAVDALAALPQPAAALPDLPAQLERLNAGWDLPRPEPRTGLTGLAVRRQRAALGLDAALDGQREFNSTVVQVLNGYLDRSSRLHAQLAQLASALVQYLQRLLPVVDARDRVASALATTRSELMLDAFDRRQESLSRRLEGLLALRDRVETFSEEMRAIRSALAAAPPSAPVAAAADRAAEDARYVAFENAFRGDAAEIRERLAGYVDLFTGQEPVVDLGCGRGEFLILLGERGIAARGVEGNAQAVARCREQGLDVTAGDLLEFLRAQAVGALGGLFAAQVVEHLPPRVLLDVLAEAHRVLRPGGLLVLETVNPRSVLAYVEVYLRDLTHERALHPDTLRFLAAAQGFTDVRVEMRSPVDAASRLQLVPVEGLPPRAAAILNENLARLDGLLYGSQEYALVARR